MIPYLILNILGVIMVYSSTAYLLIQKNQNPNSSAIKQATYAVIGLVIIALLYKMKTKVFQNKGLMMSAILVISFLLVLTRFTSLSETANGAYGWVNLPVIGTIQPAEFLKIMIVWYLAYILSRRQTMIQVNVKQAVLRPFLLVGILIGLVLLQKDTGGAMMLTLIAMVMFLASGVNYLYTIILGVGTFGLGAIVTELVLLSGGKIFPGSLKYIYKRFEVFRNPFVDPQVGGHQMINSYIAMKNGGWFGVGLGNSTQKKGFLPEAHTDYIFSIVIEELGLVVAIGILLLLGFMILRMFLVGIRAESAFNSLMCIGIASIFLIQVFVNIGGIAGLIPATGVTFPFLSQGGSSLLMLSIATGFVLNISADEKRTRDKHELAGLESE